MRCLQVICAGVNYMSRDEEAKLRAQPVDPPRREEEKIVLQEKDRQFVTELL